METFLAVVIMAASFALLAFGALVRKEKNCVKGHCGGEKSGDKNSCVCSHVEELAAKQSAQQSSKRAPQGATKRPKKP